MIRPAFSMGLLCSVLGAAFFPGAGALNAAEAENPAAKAAGPAAATEPRKAKEQDKKQMLQIWQAIIEYKKAHGQLPDYLSDLVPEYLPDKAVLVSPVPNAYHRGSGDPKLKTTYSYEFSAAAYGAGGLPFRKIKELQMTEFGPVVPILRCFAHGPVVMNVAYSGDYFESELFWETSPAAQELMEKRGLGPGFEDGDFAELRVVDDQTGGPLAGAEVRLTHREYHQLSLPDRTLKTDQEGKVRVPLGPPPARQLFVAVTKPGYTSRPEWWSEGDLPVLKTWPMAVAATIGGVVKDRAGAPLTGATVMVYGKWTEASGTNEADTVAGILRGRRRVALAGVPVQIEVQLPAAWTAKCTTDEAGRWHCDTLPASFGALRLTVEQPAAWRTEYLCEADGAAPAKREAAALRVDREALLGQTAEFRLDPAPVVSGVLLGADGAPLAGEEISVVAAATARTPRIIIMGNGPRMRVVKPPLKVLTTDADGRFSMPWPKPGELSLSAAPKDFAMVARTVTVAPGMPAIELKATLRRQITGRVHDDAGRPLAGVTVTFIGWVDTSAGQEVAVTDEKGDFAWDAAPSEQCGLTLRAPGYVQSTEWVPVEKKDAIKVELRKE